MVDIRQVPQLQLFVSCRKLADVDRFSVSDPRVEVQIKGHGQADFQHFGLSEIAWNNLNPDFAEAFVLDYHFEEQVGLRFNVFHVRDRSGDIRNAVLIGTVECSLHDIVGSQGQQLIRTLRVGSSQESRGHIIMRVEEIQQGKDVVKMQIVGTKLEDRSGWFRSFKPYLAISRALESGGYQVVHKTDVIASLNPVWAPFEIPVQVLCNNDYNRPLRLEVFDSHHTGKIDTLGFAMTSLADVTESGRKQFPIVNQEKQKKRGYANSGILELRAFEVIKKYDFLDYITGGCEISLLVAIDFTGSNGHPRYPNSLHFLNPQGFNDYEKALFSVGEILLSYDSDKLVPLYGFGGKFNGNVSHCFPLSFSSDPNVVNMDGMMRAYRQALERVELSGPTLFAQVIQSAVMMAESEQVSQQNQHYYVMLIITDGAIHDMQQTIDWIVRGSFAPLSIVIVGVGKDDFGNMDTLDADDRPLVDSRGVKMDRDIVQFVPFRDCGNSASMLTKEVLAEIPREIVNFFQKHNIAPNPPLPKPEYDPLQRGNTLMQIPGGPSPPPMPSQDPQYSPAGPLPPQGGYPPYPTPAGGYPPANPQQYAYAMGNSLVSGQLKPGPR